MAHKAEMELTREEIYLIAGMRRISKFHKDNTSTTIKFVDFGREKPHVGHMQINRLTPNQIVVIYLIEEKEVVTNG